MKQIILKFALTSILFAAISFSACKRQEPQQKLVEPRVASGVRNDTLLLGIYFGMSQDSFFKHCKMLNHREMVKQGPQMEVEYELKGRNSLKFPAKLEFYPTFKNREIHGLTASFSYNAWAPWLKETYPDKLLLDVVNLMERWYGKGFVKKLSSKKEVIFTKEDGNRQIVVWVKDETTVMAIFIDLSVPLNNK